MASGSGGESLGPPRSTVRRRDSCHPDRAQTLSGNVCSLPLCFHCAKLRGIQLSKLLAVLKEALSKAMTSVGFSFTLLCFLMGTSRLRTSVWVTLCCCDKTCNRNDFWKKKCILAEGSRGQVCRGGGGVAAGSWSKKLRESADHSFNCRDDAKRGVQRRQENGMGL